MNKPFAIILMAANLMTLGLAQGTILWNETVNGPFADYYQNSTALGELTLGTNTIVGATEIEPLGGNYLVHDDYFNFLVPVSARVVGIYLQIDKPNVWTWLGDTSYGSALGYDLNSSNGDFMTQSSIAPIRSGHYAMYIANHDAGPSSSVANYRLDFVVIPEPAAWSVLCLSGVALFLKRQPCAQGNRQEQ